MAAFTGSSSGETHVFNPTEDPVDLAGGVDTLLFNTTQADISTITLTNTEILKAGLSTPTTFTINQADLVANGSIIGSSGTDTLVTADTELNLSSTTLSSIEKIVAGNTGDTIFTVDQADLANNGSVVGNNGDDTLVANGLTLNLLSTTLSSVEILKAGKSSATTFTVDALDLDSGGSVIGGTSANDTLVVNDVNVDLTSTTLSSVEILKAGKSAATTFTLNDDDLATTGSVIGSTGSDTLVAADTALDLSGTTLTSVEKLTAGNTAATKFTVDQADLASGGSVIGSGDTSDADTLEAAGTQLNLSSTTLSSVEILKAGTTNATTFTVDQADLIGLGTSDSEVIGGSSADTLSANGTALNLTSTTLTSVEKLLATKTATTFTVDQADLLLNGSVVGVAGNDTLVSVDTTLDLSGTTLSSVEILKAGNTGPTEFTVDQADLASGGSVLGNTAAGTNGNDTLIAAGATLNLSSTTLSSVETLQAGTGADTTITVDQADLLSGGSVTGSTGTDTLAAAGTALNLTSTTLTSVEKLAATKAATTFTVNQTNLDALSSVVGSTGNDTLLAVGTEMDLSGTTLSSVEILKAGNAGNTTFTVDQADLTTSGGSVIGSSGTDTLLANGLTLNLSNTTLSSIENLAASQAGTKITVDQADLVSGGSVTGTVGNDTLAAAGTSLNLSSTTLTGVEILEAGKSTATTFTVDAADLASGGSVIGSSGTDTLIVNGAALDLRSTALSNIEILKGTSSNPTTFTLNQGDLATGGSVIGSSGNDTLITADTELNLSNTTLSSVEILKAGTTNGTTFTVDQADLAANGSIVGAANSGTNGVDTLATVGSALNLTSTTLSSIEQLESKSTGGTVFTLDQLDFNGITKITGSTGAQDGLVVFSSIIDLSSRTVTNVEKLQAGLNVSTIFTVNQADLAAGGSVIGSTGFDTLIAADTQLNLSNTALSSIETLQAGNVGATTFTVDQADLMSGGSVVGSSGNDTLAGAGTLLDLTSTTLSSVEILASATTNGTTFKLDGTDFAGVTSITGSTGSDTLIVTQTNFDVSGKTLTSVDKLQAALGGTTFTVNDPAVFTAITGTTGNDTLVSLTTQFDLSGTALSSVEILKAGNAGATTFKVNQADLASGGSVIGSSGSDTLQTVDSQLNLSSTTLSSVEKIAAGTTNNTTFTVDQADLASSGSVIGSGGTDTLVANGTLLDLSSTTLSSVEKLAASKAATTFIVNQADLGTSGGVTTITGSTGNDTLATADTQLNLTSTTLSSVEILKAGTTNGTAFRVNQADLASGGSVIGSSGNDTLIAGDSQLDLRSTTLSSVETLLVGDTNGTTFIVDQADIGTSVFGSSGIDILVINGTSLDLSSTGLSAIDILRAGKSAATTFIVNQNDLTSGGSVEGSSGNDTLVAADTQLNLTSTTLSSVEILKAGKSSATTFTVDQADLATNGTIGGSVVGSSGSDSLILGSGTELDLTHTTLSSVEIIGTTTGNTTFTVNAADLASGGSVLGSGGTDTLIILGTSFNLASTAASSIEKLQADSANGTNATTFTVDQADLASNGSVIGTSGTDLLVANGTTLNLSSTTLTSVEILKASKAGTNFTVDQADLAASGSVIGTTGNDTLTLASGSQLDLTATTLSSVEILTTTTGATTFLVDKADLAAGGSVIGSGGSDSLIVKGTDVNLTSTTLSSVEKLVAETAGATTFTVDQADLASGGSVIGGGGSDKLVANGTTLDLSSTTLSSVESLNATKAGTVFTVNQADLGTSGGVTAINGTTGNDTLVAADTQLNLTSTTLSSVEILKAGNAGDTTFTVDQEDLAANGSLIGSSGTDTLLIAGTAPDLGGTTLSSVEILKASTASDTYFTVDQADLANGGSVIGSSGSDKLFANGTLLDLSSTTLSSIETLQAAQSAATTFIVDQADLATSGGSVIGSSGNDTLVAAGVALNLTSTTLSSVEILKAGTSSATTFTVDQADLTAGGTSSSVIGSTSNDTLVINGISLDLTGTTLSSIEILQNGTSLGTTFTIDQADLASGGSVIGTTTAGTNGNDTLEIKGTSLNLSSTTIISIEELKAGTAPTVFTVNQADIASAITITGTTGDDTLVAADTQLNLTSTTLTSVEILKAGNSAATTFTVNTADLATSGSVIGSSGTDTLAISGASSLDLSNTTLSSVEILKGNSSSATIFTVDQADLASNGSVVGITTAGTSGNDTLVAAGTELNLTSTTLTSVEILKAGNVAATKFTVDQADLASGGSVIGNSGTDILVAAGTELNLSSTTLSSIETLQAGKSVATTFTLDNADLTDVTAINGSSGIDTIVAVGTELDLSGTTLSAIEIITGGNTNTTYTLSGANLDKLDDNTGAAITGGTGTHDILVFDDNADLSHIAVTGIEEYLLGDSLTLKIDQADLVSGGSITASSAGDFVLIEAAGSSLDLTSTTLTDIDSLQAGHSSGTTFTLLGNQLANIDAIQANGTDGVLDTLVVTTTNFNLSSTTIDFVEILKAGSASNTTFTLDQADLNDLAAHASTGGVGFGQILGSSGNDTLVVNGNTIDLSSTTLSSVETIKTSTPSNATTFTLSNGQGGATLELTANGKSDTIDLDAAYKLGNITDSAEIAKHVITINNFTDGATNGDVIDIANLTNGTPTEHQDITGFINLVNPATLKDALNIAAAGNGSTTSTVVSFQFGGDTYVLIDKSSDTTLNANDAVVKLTGLHTLTDADNFNF